MKTNFNVVGVIPARYESKRLSHKLLRTIQGKSLLQWTWENALTAGSLDKLIIACDHFKIEKEAQGFGAEVVLTSSEHSSGTDRIAEAVKGIYTKIIINLQADEPFIHYSVIDSLAEEISADPSLVMATAKKKIEEEGEINNPNVVKVITTRKNFAIYFSRFPIPFYRASNNISTCSANARRLKKVYYKHLGIYAYTKDFLCAFGGLPASFLERAEKLEQLRVLDAGYKIKVIETQFDSCGVDTEEDFQKAERILAEKKS